MAWSNWKYRVNVSSEPLKWKMLFLKSSYCEHIHNIHKKEKNVFRSNKTYFVLLILKGKPVCPKIKGIIIKVYTLAFIKC